MPGRLNPAFEVRPDEAAAQFIRLFPPDALVAVALSGGGDSVGLLTALHEAATLLNLPVRLAAITVDHGLRAGSAAEAAAMAKFCRSIGVPHLIRRWEGDKPSSGLLDAAREARYQLLVEAGEALGATCLVTAHTLDDQLETVEMRRARSDPGARGLAGMAPASLYFGRLWSFRPFLSVRRAAIRAYLRSRGIDWIDDPSNDDPRFERVRLRRRGDFAMGVAEIAAAQASRQALSVAAADILARHGSSPMPLLFTLHDDACRDDDAFGLAFAALVAVAGGQTHLPGQEQVARVFSHLSGGAGSVSMGRTVIERWKGALHICRDRRNLPELVLPAGDMVPWDGRFAVRNITMQPLRVVAGGMAAMPDALAPRIAKRAGATLPTRQGEGDMAGLVVMPRLAPFETVLTSFDEALAGELCQLSGRVAMPPSLAFQAKTSEKCA